MAHGTETPGKGGFVGEAACQAFLLFCFHLSGSLRFEQGRFCFFVFTENVRVEQGRESKQGREGKGVAKKRKALAKGVKLLDD